MSNFMKKGQRQMKVANDKKVKQHIKSFYKIIGIMDEVANKLDPSIDYNEDNINDYVKPLLGRDLDAMEKFLILGKVFKEVKNETKNNI
jgi:hypothetical protein